MRTMMNDDSVSPYNSIYETLTSSPHSGVVVKRMHYAHGP